MHIGDVWRHPPNFKEIYGEQRDVAVPSIGGPDSKIIKTCVGSMGGTTLILSGAARISIQETDLGWILPDPDPIH